MDSSWWGSFDDLGLSSPTAQHMGGPKLTVLQASSRPSSIALPSPGLGGAWKNWTQIKSMFFSFLIDILVISIPELFSKIKIGKETATALV